MTWWYGIMDLIIDKRITSHVKIFDYRLKKIIFRVIKISLGLEKIYVKPQIGILILNNKQIQEINKRFRGVDKPTDVLSFPLIDFESNPDKDKNDLIKEDILLGEIVININKVFLQARDYLHSPEREIGFLTAHGILHLLGYDHIDPLEEKIMFDKQDLILKRAKLNF